MTSTDINPDSKKFQLIIINTKDGPIYLAAGHTRPSRTTGYLHFFYTFEASPPFRIVNMSSLFKLDKSETIQFVSGLSQFNNSIYVSYGVNDCSNRIAHYDINDIFGLFEDCDKSSQQYDQKEP